MSPGQDGARNLGGRGRRGEARAGPARASGRATAATAIGGAPREAPRRAAGPGRLAYGDSPAHGRGRGASAVQPVDSVCDRVDTSRAWWRSVVRRASGARSWPSAGAVAGGAGQRDMTPAGVRKHLGWEGAGGAGRGVERRKGGVGRVGRAAGGWRKVAQPARGSQ